MQISPPRHVGVCEADIEAGEYFLSLEVFCDIIVQWSMFKQDPFVKNDYISHLS